MPRCTLLQCIFLHWHTLRSCPWGLSIPCKIVHHSKNGCRSRPVVCHCSLLCIMSNLFLFPYSSIPNILVQVYHQSIGCCSSTQSFYDLLGSLIFIFLRFPMAYIFWKTFCIYSGKDFSWLLTLTRISVVKGFVFSRERIPLSFTTDVFWNNFVVPKFASTLLLLKNVLNSWFGHTYFLFSL